jgi:O-antigen ligase
VSSNRASRSGSRSGRPRPLPKGNTLFTPDASASRQALEHRSATSLLWLHQLPRWLLPLLAAGLLVTGFAVGGAGGAAALCGLAVVLGWLAAVSWPRLSAHGRLLRVAAIGAVVAIALVRGFLAG